MAQPDRAARGAQESDGGSAAARPMPGAKGTTPGRRADDPSAREPTTGPGDSRLGWVALTVTAVLLVWQAIYAITVAGPGLDGREVYTQAWLLVSLVLAVGAVVLGIVGVTQRVQPRWPATAALSIGSYVFLVCLATWAGSLIDTAS